jgi:hypothetical protein
MQKVEECASTFVLMVLDVCYMLGFVIADEDDAPSEA